MEKILIIRLSSIGDIILTTPLIRSVRQKYPQAQIDFLVKHQFKPLLEYNPHITNLITFNKSSDDIKSLKAQIKNTNYSWIIDIHRNFRSYFLTRGMAPGLVTRYKKYIFKRQLLVWFGINSFSENKPVLERYFEALKPLNISYDGGSTEVFVPEEEHQQVAAKLSSDGYNGSQKIVAICPGASFANKRWFAERFATVADELAEKENGYVILLGGPEDEKLGNDIISKMSSGAINYAGKLSLLGSAAMLSKASLAVTNDTGLMHLAQSQNIPVAAIFGPTTKELGYFPIADKSEVLEAAVSCRPCTHNGSDKCPKGHFKCMENITVENVVTASQNLLKLE